MPADTLTRTHAGQVLVTEYGCCRCQRTHRKGIDPEYGPHLIAQSKHGYYTRVATPDEVLALLRGEDATAAG